MNLLVSRVLSVSFTLKWLICSKQVFARGVSRQHRSQPCRMLIFPNRIGFGRYQQQLFVLSGLGWLADSEFFFAIDFWSRPYLGCDDQPHIHYKSDPTLFGVLITIPRSLVPRRSYCSSPGSAGIESVSNRIHHIGPICGLNNGGDDMGCAS